MFHFFRYRREEDYELYSSNLIIRYLDLEDMSSIAEFVEFCFENVPHLDVLINNAAQTIARPQAYYAALKKQEDSFQFIKTDSPLEETLEPPAKVLRMNSDNGTGNMPITRRRSAMALKLQMLDKHQQDTDVFSPNTTARFFPVGSVDEHGEQLDLRPR
jgi:NAD(P)-dependent dehydrogenase (short-subunit alcohol dehydrogenase family)